MAQSSIFRLQSGTLSSLPATMTNFESQSAVFYVPGLASTRHASTEQYDGSVCAFTQLDLIDGDDSFKTSGQLPSEDPQDDLCPICFDKFDDRLWECGHSFCGECTQRIPRVLLPVVEDIGGETCCLQEHGLFATCARHGLLWKYYPDYKRKCPLCRQFVRCVDTENPPLWHKLHLLSRRVFYAKWGEYPCDSEREAATL